MDALVDGDKIAATKGSSVPGYWMLEANSDTYSFGDASPCRSTATGSGVDAIDFDGTADGQALWILSSEGVVNTSGSAAHFGDVDLSTLAAGDHVASISATPSGLGYWIFTDLGQVLTFGDAQHFGDLPNLGITPAGLVVASVPTLTGFGYYLLGSDGGVFNFSDQEFLGSLGTNPPDTPIVAITAYTRTRPCARTTPKQRCRDLGQIDPRIRVMNPG